MDTTSTVDLEVNEDVQKTPVTVGLLLGITGGVLAVVGYTVTVVLWINTISATAKADSIENGRKIDTINVKLLLWL